MKNPAKLLVWALFLLNSGFVSAQNVKIFGYVKDAKTGETLVGANVYTSDGSSGCATNSYGFYSFEIPENWLTEVNVSFVGYQKFNFDAVSKRDTNVNIFLTLNDTLSVFEVLETKSTEIKHGGMTIPIETLKNMPSLGGEPDILKALSFLPGIATGVEGTSGLYVRGGTPDQNLILLDDAIVYNTSHLFGFMSILNPNAVKSANIYKGGFPARYGGRLSSVIDVTMKEGSNKKRQREISVGIINSNLVFEGPIKKDKSSYIISARGAYLGLLNLLSLASYSSSQAASYRNITIYDINAKVNFDLPKQQKLFLSCYVGQDNFSNWRKSSGIDNRFSLQWGNKTASLRYTNILSANLFANATINYNNFFFETDVSSLINDGKDLNYRINKRASVEDISAKFNVELYKEKHSLKFGMDAGQHYFQPNRLDLTGRFNNTNSFEKSNYENVLSPQSVAVFAEDAIAISPSLNLNLGLRWLNYFFKTSNYSSLEPRVILSFILNKNSHIDASFTQMGQYVHLLSASTGALGNDIWVPSTEGVPLEKAKQVALSYSQKWDDLGWTFQFETYYKRSENLIDYRQGTNLFLFDKNWEQIIEKNGKGKAYGCEFFLKKEGESWNGWLSYTLAWSERQFENINSGNWFPQRYDRRHNLNLVFEKKIADAWTFNADFVFTTGSAVTIPVAVFKSDNGIITPFYEDRNNGRMPIYHRLDIAFSYRYLNRKKRDEKWTFSLFNAYGQNNASALNYTVGMSFLSDGGRSYEGLFRPETFFRFVPGVNWSVKF